MENLVKELLIQNIEKYRSRGVHDIEIVLSPAQRFTLFGNEDKFYGCLVRDSLNILSFHILLIDRNYPASGEKGYPFIFRIDQLEAMTVKA